MKRLNLFFFVCLLTGIIACQEDVQKNETLSEFEKIEKSLPASLLTDSSFLALKNAYLFMRDYTGPKPDSIGDSNVTNCIHQSMLEDSVNLSQIATRSEFISYVIGVSNNIPEIVADCGLDDNQYEYYAQASFQFSVRSIDLIDRYEELQNEKNPFAVLLEEFNLPDMTPEYWRNR